jgi:hypothetical protein
MRRRILNVAAAVSLALCVALVALAVRSGRTFESVFLSLGQQTIGANSYAGELQFVLVGQASPSWAGHMKMRHEARVWKMLHFDCNLSPRYQGSPWFAALTLPDWALALPLGSLAWWFRRKACTQAQVGFAVEPVTSSKSG